MPLPAHVAARPCRMAAGSSSSSVAGSGRPIGGSAAHGLAAGRSCGGRRRGAAAAATAARPAPPCLPRAQPLQPQPPHLRPRQAQRPRPQPPHAEPGGGSSSSSSEQGQEQERQVVYNTEFGYSRKDVLVIIVALIALGVLMYEGLQAAGMDAGMAGNWVQLVIFLGICVGWVSTYLWRVANKKMTYAQQLTMYEEAVMRKRLEEMTEAELQQLMQDVEQDKDKLAAAKEALEKQRGAQQ